MPTVGGSGRRCLVRSEPRPDPAVVELDILQRIGQSRSVLPERRRSVFVGVLFRVFVVVAAGCVPPPAPAPVAPKPDEWCAEAVVVRDDGERLVHQLCRPTLAECQEVLGRAERSPGYESLGQCQLHHDVPPPQPPAGGCAQTSGSSSGGCVKGCRCGNACIDCSDTCHGGETYRRRKR